MGLFDFWKKKSSKALFPDEVLAELLSAHSRYAYQELSRLCEEHQKVILMHYAEWQRCPEVFRDQPHLLENYVQTLLTVAKTFENAGYPQLQESISGDEKTNPLAVWEQDLRMAAIWLEENKFDVVIEILSQRLTESAHLIGPAMDHFLPRTHGMIGIAWFRKGELKWARAHTQLALNICERINDIDGTVTYANNLSQMNEKL